jgi:predicted HicB family RNase H-like nuclease
VHKFSSTDAVRSADATLSLGVSGSLKDRIDDAAKAENLSVDAWALRAMEDALKLDR